LGKGISPEKVLLVFPAGSTGGDTIEIMRPVKGKTCFLHRVDVLLREAGVHPYIWRNAELGSLFRRLEG
jgi:hypothetical protein